MTCLTVSWVVTITPHLVTPLCTTINSTRVDIIILHRIDTNLRCSLSCQRAGMPTNVLFFALVFRYSFRLQILCPLCVPVLDTDRVGRSRYTKVNVWRDLGKNTQTMYERTRYFLADGYFFLTSPPFGFFFPVDFSCCCCASATTTTTAQHVVFYFRGHEHHFIKS